MSITRKVAAVASAIALGTTCLMTAEAGVSHAAPSPTAYTICKLRHNANYPPGKCFLRFNKAAYHRHNDAKFFSGRDFRPGESLTLVLRCTNGYHRHRNLVHGFSYHHVGPKGRTHGHYHLTHITPYGVCTLTITGKTSHSKVRGSFRVTKKKHHHHKKKK